MTRLSHSEVAALARGEGLADSQVIIACAISGWDGSPYAGESGGNPSALGDIGLQTSKWGPSVGLWQVRSLNADKGTGRTRDQDALLDPRFNAKSMKEISSSGTNWQPWSVYTSGEYRKNLTESERLFKAGQAGPSWSVGSYAQAGPSWSVGSDAQADGGWSVGSSGITPPAIPGLGSITSLFTTLADGGFWRRLGLGALGIVVALVGLVLIFGDTIGSALR